MYEFSAKNFAALCTTGPDRQRFRDPSLVEKKTQVNYIAGYLAAPELDCKTIVREDDYVDADFLDDYAAYYVRCFAGYPRKCTRLHFFRNGFTQKEFDQLLEGQTPLRASLKSNDSIYLGFLVLRPLPETFIGRCCLRHFPDDGGRRRYPGALSYQAHIAGIELSVPSLAFQEQDTVLSACATSALWSALQRTGDLFNHPPPTPAQITRAATKASAVDGRMLPSEGLEVAQICHAIHSLGLEVECRQHEELQGGRLKELVHAYAGLGIPVVLGIRPQTGEKHLLHAVTLAGYSLPPRSLVSTASPRLVAHAIDKLYLHDDQRGPFIRAPFVPAYDTTLFLGEGNAIARACDVFAFIAPVYPKIRIRYETVHDHVIQVDALLQAVLNAPLHWDIGLAFSTAMTEEYGKDAHLAARLRADVLSQAYPRFVWRARALSEFGSPVAELVVDATDIERSFIVCKFIVLSREVARIVGEIVGSEEHRQVIQDGFASHADKWLDALARAAAVHEGVGA